MGRVSKAPWATRFLWRILSLDVIAGNISKELHLVAAAPWPGCPAEPAGVEGRSRPIEAVLAPGSAEAFLQKLRVGTRAAHPRPELRLIEGAPSGLTHQRFDVLRFRRVVCLEPLGEEVFELEREPQEDVARGLGARERRFLEDALELGVVERGDHG